MSSVAVVVVVVDAVVVAVVDVEAVPADFEDGIETKE